MDCYASAMRHGQAWARVEDLDVGPNGEFGPYPDAPEIDMRWTGLTHAVLAAWHWMALTTFFARGVGEDDLIPLTSVRRFTSPVAALAGTSVQTGLRVLARVIPGVGRIIHIKGQNK